MDSSPPLKSVFDERPVSPLSSDDYLGLIGGGTPHNLAMHYDRDQLLQLIQMGGSRSQKLAHIYIQRNQQIIDGGLLQAIVNLMITAEKPDDLIGKITVENYSIGHFPWPQNEELKFVQKTHGKLAVQFNAASANPVTEHLYAAKYSLTNGDSRFQVCIFYYRKVDNKKLVAKFVYRRLRKVQTNEREGTGEKDEEGIADEEDEEIIWPDCEKSDETCSTGSDASVQLPSETPWTILPTVPSSGMPIIGLGTGQSNEGEVAKALRFALKHGYRMIDTAKAYENEAEIGQVLQEFFKSGDLMREDIFVVTKLFWCFNHAEEVESQLRSQLKALQLDYVDLYLVNMPAGLKHDLSAPDNDCRLEDVWRGMEKVYDLKLARAIGTSNFNAAQLERVQRQARVPIHCNEVECHLHLNQKPLQDAQKRMNIAMIGYGNLGSPGRSDMQFPVGGLAFHSSKQHSSPVENAVVKRLAAKYGKTPAQILLRNLTQRGIVVIPKSTNEQHLLENITIFDFTMTDTEQNELLAVEQESRIYKLQFMEGSIEDPFKEERVKQK